MIVEVELQRPSTKQHEKFEVWGVKAKDISLFIQTSGRAKLDVLIKGLARRQMPQHLQTYEIVDWKFKE